MRKILILTVLVCLMLPASSAFAQNGSPGKIKPSVPSASPGQLVGAFVELVSPNIAMSATFGGKNPYHARELMRPGNTLTIFHESMILRAQKRHLEKVRNLAPKARIGMSFQYAFNGYFIEAGRESLEQIARLDEVKSIFSLKEPTIQRTKTRGLIGADKVWETVKDPKGRNVDGKGVLIGVTDTGLDYTHPDFGSQKSPIGPKVVVSRDLGMTDNDCQEENMGMHGTACASLAAGDGPDNAKTGVKEKGIAPKALLAGFKGSKIVNGQEVFTQEAAMGSWEYVIKDKIDISSNSWGIPTGEHEHEERQKACTLAGCLVVCANGNYGTAGKGNFPHPQSSSGAGNMVIGVGATDDVNASFLTISDKSGKNSKYSGMWGYTGKTLEKSETPLRIVDCLWGRAGEFPNVKGKVALIERGPFNPVFGDAITFVEKVDNAFNAGAIAIVMVNSFSDLIYADYVAGRDPADPDFRMLPVYEVESYKGEAIKRRLHDMNAWKPGAVDRSQREVFAEFSKPQTKATMAFFSSNGPTKLGYLKPDVCAGGIGLHSAISKYYWALYKDYYYDNMGGTSGATPLVAGAAALVKQARPGWSPYEIKRALMNTATLLTKLDGSRFLPFVAQGMGRVNAIDAVTANILVQPPSALIVAGTGKVNIADRPEELDDQKLQAGIPEKILKSTVPLKVYNYSDKEALLSLSYEINSGKPGQIKVNFSSTETVVPPAKDKPGTAWIGVDVRLPRTLWGFQNDIIIWMTDKVTNKRIHTGICVYNGDPAVGGAQTQLVKEISAESWLLTPNGDGMDDEIEFAYDITNGSLSGGPYPYWSNHGAMLTFWVKDKGGEDWSLIHQIEEFEPGPGSFVWDGRDIDGKMVLPDGEWQLGVKVLCKEWDSQKSANFDRIISFGQTARFEIRGSQVKPPPTVSAFPSPVEPVKGETFTVNLQLSEAGSVKTLDFKISIPHISNVAVYSGFEEGKFGGDSLPSVASVDFDKEAEIFTVSFDKQGEPMRGDGVFLKLKFKAQDAGFLDLFLSGINATAIDGFGKESKTRIFSRDSEIVIAKTSHNRSDFNRDGQVDQIDYEIITSLMGTKDGDRSYNWRCDLNFDGTISLEDMAIFAKSYISP